MHCFKKNYKLFFDRSFSSGLGKQIIWLLAIMLVVYVLLIILSYIKTLYSPGEGDSLGRWYDVFFLLMDPGSSSGAMTSPFVIICSLVGLVVFSGMLISVISNVLERRVESYQNGETVYKLRDHIVIIGYNDSVPSLVSTLRTKGEHRDEDLFIVIQSSQVAEDIRSRLHMSSDKWMEKNTIVLHGQENSIEDLEKLYISKSKEVWIIGDETLEAHDSTNLECLSLVSELCEGRSQKLDCHVLFEHQTVYSVFQFSELQKTIQDHVHFHPFNLHENWAKKVLVEGKAGEIAYKPLEGEKGLQKNSKEHVHMIIIGMSFLLTV